MKIQKSPAWVPAVVRTEIQSTPRSLATTPGFLVRLGDVPITTGPAGVRAAAPLATAPPAPRCLMVRPQETKALLANPEVAALLKMITKQVAAQIHPHVKTGVDAIFLAYGVRNLIEDWKQPGADRTLCLFKTLGLTLSASSLAGSVCPDVRLPDHWANGIDFVASVGGDLYQGKIPSALELTLGRHPSGALPMQLIKVVESAAGA